MAKTNESLLVAERYARALFDLAQEQKLADALEADLAALLPEIEKKGELSSLLTNPLLGRDQGKKAMAAVLDGMKAPPLVKQFFGTLAANRRLDIAGPAVRSFLTMARERRGEVTAEVTSAAELTAQDKEKLVAALITKFGKKVRLETKVNPSLLGGLTVKAMGRMLDYSTAGRLDRLAQALKTAPLEKAV